MNILHEPLKWNSLLLDILKYLLNHISVPPKITCSKGYDSFTTVGGTLQITCAVHSNPRANITWEVTNSTEGIIDSPREEGNIRAIEEVNFPLYFTKYNSRRKLQSCKRKTSKVINFNPSDFAHHPNVDGKFYTSSSFHLIGKFVTLAFPQELEDDKIRATLNIQKVGKEHITPVRLSVENKLGRHSVTIKVNEGTMPVDKPVSLNDNPGHNNPSKYDYVRSHSFAGN